MLLLLAIGAHAAPGVPLPGTMRTAYFTVHYDLSDPYLAEIMADTAREQLVRIAGDLGYRLDGIKRFPLYVYPTHVGFIEAGGLETSKFTVGTTVSGSEKISVDASGAFVLPEEVLAHEITHAVIFRILGPNTPALPLWVNEGLAKYESQELTDDDDELIADAAADGALIPLEDLRTAFPPSRNALAYAESSSAVRYMIRRNGKRAPRVLLRELAATGSFDRSMHEAVGKTGDGFASDWYEATTQRYSALRFTRVSTAVISVLMAALAVLAYLARQRQKAEAAKRWEQEEFEKSLRAQRGNDWSEPWHWHGDQM